MVTRPMPACTSNAASAPGTEAKRDAATIDQRTMPSRQMDTIHPPRVAQAPGTQARGVLPRDSSHVQRCAMFSVVVVDCGRLTPGENRMAFERSPVGSTLPFGADYGPQR